MAAYPVVYWKGNDKKLIEPSSPSIGKGGGIGFSVFRFKNNKGPTLSKQQRAPLCCMRSTRDNSGGFDLDTAEAGEISGQLERKGSSGTSTSF